MIQDRGLLTVLGIVLTVLLGCREGERPGLKAPSVPQEMTEAQKSKPIYEDLTGNPVQLSDYHGKRVLINYWATWCKPCIEEMPALEKLQKELSEENYVFLFASDQSTEIIQKFKKSKGFDFTYVKYNGVWSDLGISALPVTVIVNEVGERIARFDGAAAWEAPEMSRHLKELH